MNTSNVNAYLTFALNVFILITTVVLAINNLIPSEATVGIIGAILGYSTGIIVKRTNGN